MFILTKQIVIPISKHSSVVYHSLFTNVHQLVDSFREIFLFVVVISGQPVRSLIGITEKNVSLQQSVLVVVSISVVRFVSGRGKYSMKGADDSTSTSDVALTSAFKSVQSANSTSWVSKKAPKSSTAKKEAAKSVISRSNKK